MKSAVIYGATGTGKHVYQEVKDKYEILYFVDENPLLKGKSVESLEVCEPKRIVEKKPDIVIMGILTGYEEAISYLLEQGILEEQIVTKYVDLSSRARRDSLEKISFLFKEKEIKGAIAELGVYRGDFAKVMNETFPDRKLYLFDTFEGFPEEDIQYEHKNNLLLNEVGKLANTSVDYVLNKMPYKEQCIIRKGYFPDTADGLEETYAFVNIDVDLYKPILAGLEYFWPRMADNGYIFVHDYFSFSYAGAKKAINEFAKKYNTGFIPIGDTLSIEFLKKY